MIRSVTFNEKGEADSVIVFADPEDVEGLVIEDEEIEDEYILDRWYISEGNVKERDPRPSDHHEWDMGKEVWVEDVEGVRAECISDVDFLAEERRLKHITPGSGQAATYEAKHQEAIAYPEGGPFPFLEAEAESLEKTLRDVANTVIAKRKEWEQAGSLIEAARMKAKAKIRRASTPAEMHNALKEFEESV